MTRLLLVLVFCALPLSGGETYTIGRTDSGPAPGGRSKIRGASSATGHLAAWIDRRAGAEVLATRLAADGSPLDGDGLRLGSTYGWDSDEVVVGSNGRDYLVAWSGRGLRIARVTAGGVVTVRDDVDLNGSPLVLVSNGRSYLLIFITGGTVKGILLDASGRPMSGTLVIRGWPSAAPAPSGEYFVTYGNSEGIAGGVLSEEQFGRLGQTRLLRTLPRIFRGGASVRAGADEQGLYTIRREFAAPLLRYQRHDAETGAPLGWPVEIVPDGLFGRDLQNVFATTIGHSLYVLYPKHTLAGFVRVSESGAVVPVDLPGGAVGFDAFLLRGTSAPLLLWTDHRARVEMHAALAGSNTWHSGGHLLSKAPRLQTMPRLARGSRGHLAVWLEDDAYTSLMGRLIDENGRPLTEPVVIGGYAADVVVAFDGERFLVVWETGLRDVEGRFVDDRGNLSGDAFTIAYEQWRLASLVWDDGQYIVSTVEGAHRLDRRGVPLSDEPLDVDSQLLYLTICGECNQRYAGIRASVWSTGLAAGPDNVLYGSFSLSEVSERTLPGELGGFPSAPRGAWGWDNIAPAFAAGGGWTLAIVHDAWSGLLDLWSLERMPYDVPYGRKRLQAEWNGSRFVVAAGGTLALHDAKGKVLQHQPIAATAIDSAFVLDGPHAVTVLFQRGHRIEATRIELP